MTAMEENIEIYSFHSLFSCLITLFTLILIYFPNASLRILFSPVLLITGALLVLLLRLGSTRDSDTRPGKIRENQQIRSVNLEEAKESLVLVHDSYTKPDLMGDFVEWNLRAPLEVIHEAYDEEEEEDDDDDDDEENPNPSSESDPTRITKIERFPSLSFGYPESDSESDSFSSSEFNFPDMSNWISPEKLGFKWEEEEEEEDGIGDEGLIEIKLSEYHRIHNSKINQTEQDFHGEEDGLIEIDLSP